MYSPTSRLLTLLEMLQSHRQIPGAEIARRLEVDLRTVRRYVVTLQDMGIPVEAERGPYGAYHLARGFKLPPLMFTDAEAVALTLGLLAIRELRFPVEMAAVEGALAKIERVLPEALLAQVRGLQEGVTFYVTPPPTSPDIAYVTGLSMAAQQRHPVHLGYRAFDGAVTERDFDPYGVVFNQGYWYTSGYCHLRDGLRTFRLDRITELAGAEGSFERPADFDVLAYVLASISTLSGQPEQVEVLLHTTLAHAQEVIQPVMGTLEEVEGGVMFRRAPTQLRWVAFVLIMLDFPVEVIGPEALRVELRQIADRAAALGKE